MRHMLLIYLDEAKFAVMPRSRRDACVNAMLDYDADLAASGHMVMSEALRQPAEAVTLRRRDGETGVTDGPFAETQEHLSGIIQIEARDMAEAIRLAARMALTPHRLCGLRTERIAHAYLIRTPTVAQRIVRAKARIRQLGLPYAVPAPDEIPERLGAVLRTIYLLFSEGGGAAGADLRRRRAGGTGFRNAHRGALCPASRDRRPE